MVDFIRCERLRAASIKRREVPLSRARWMAKLLIRYRKNRTSSARRSVYLFLTLSPSLSRAERDILFP